MNKLKKFLFKMLAGANVMTVVIMLAVGYSYKLNPQLHPISANMGLVFPVLLLINIGFLLLFLFFRKRLAPIAIGGLILGFVPVMKYCPINIPRSTPDDAIKIMSYNVFVFNHHEKKTIDEICTYINNSGASLVCLQEASYSDSIRSMFKEQYEYVDTAQNLKTGEIQFILSKFPVLSKTYINYDDTGCLSVAYEVLIKGTRTTVISCHLETSGLSQEERQEFKRMINGEWNDGAKEDSKRMIVRLGSASAKRVPQVKAILKYIESRKGEPVLLFGDFNDNPISYCHYLLDEKLTDCYRATAWGPGISYHHNNIYVRIDNIMCSADWQPYNFKVDRTIDASDHYPIYGYIKEKE